MWLNAHPKRELIVKRYLKYQHRLTRQVFVQLLEEDETDPDSEQEVHAAEEAVIEERVSLNTQRIGAVVDALKRVNATRVLDLGCGEGKLIQALLKDNSFATIAGMDVSYRTLEIAQERLRLDRLPAQQQERITLFQGSLTYRDKRFAGYDAATVIEVIEHLDPARLAVFERVLFEFAHLPTVVLTTPNIEYNVKFSGMPTGKLRHRDHRFEWTRSEFQTWATGIARRFGYTVRFLPIGPEDSIVGSPTQMGIFTRG